MFRYFAAAMDIPLSRFSMLWTMIHIAALPRMDFSQCCDGSVSLVSCHCLRLLAAVLDFPLLRVFAGSYGFLLRCYGFFFVSLEVTLLRAFTAAMIVPCCEFSSVFSDLPIQGLCRGNGVSYITGFRCCEWFRFFRIIRCCQGYRWYIHGLFVSFELRLNSNDTVQWICPLMLDWAPIVKINLNQKSEPGITCSFDCPLWNQTCIFSIKYELRISRLPFHGTRASE